MCRNVQFQESKVDNGEEWIPEGLKESRERQKGGSEILRKN